MKWKKKIDKWEKKESEWHFFKTKNTLLRKNFFNHFQCISSHLFSLPNTYIQPLQKTLLIFSKLLYHLILLIFAKYINKQIARFQHSIDLSTKKAPIRHFKLTFFFKSMFFSYIILPLKNVKIQIEFCELVIYEK